MTTTLMMMGAFVLLVAALAWALRAWEARHGWGPGWSRGKVLVTVFTCAAALMVAAVQDTASPLFWAALLVVATLLAHALTARRAQHP